MLRENSIRGRVSEKTSGTGIPVTSAYWSAAWRPEPTLTIVERRSNRTWNGNSSRNRSASNEDRLSGRHPKGQKKSPDDEIIHHRFSRSCMNTAAAIQQAVGVIQMDYFHGDCETGSSKRHVFLVSIVGQC